MEFEIGHIYYCPKTDRVMIYRGGHFFGLYFFEGVGDLQYCEIELLEYIGEL